MTDVVDQLYENTKKVNATERLSKHFLKGTDPQALHSYLNTIRKWVPAEPIIHIDYSDIIKPNGSNFELLGIVRDVSEIHSYKGKNFTSANPIPFVAVERGTSSSKKATFIMDRDYGDNKMFLKMGLIKVLLFRTLRPVLLAKTAVWILG